MLETDTILGFIVNVKCVQHNMPIMRRKILYCCMAMSFVCLPVWSLDIQGEFIQGGFAYGKVLPNDTVWFDGKRLVVSSSGEFIVGFGHRAPATMALRVDSAKGSKSHIIRIQQREYAVQHIDGLPSEQVSPPPEVWKRIREEGRLIGRARQHNTLSKNIPKSFSWPLTGRVSGVYGSRRILNGQERQPHYGIDIVCKAGTAVRAPAAGKVRLAHPEMYFSGATLVIDHGYGFSSTLIHLSKIYVQEGQTVQQGDVVAEVGSTGRSTGAHLDWRINWLGSRLDPALIAGDMPTMVCPDVVGKEE